MQPSVRAAWHSFSEPLEGRVYALYCDVFGLVTTGVGNLVDPVHAAIGLPWKRPDGTLATEAEIREQWQRVKDASQTLKKQHHRFAAALTTIRLTDADVDELVARKLASNERELERYFPAFATFPADAQLGILSMAWAVGPAFAEKFPMFTHAANAGKWWDAASHGKIREEGADGTANPGVIPRNKANKLCFQNASMVAAHRTDPSVLHWPNKHPGQFAPAPPAPARLDTPEQLGALATAAAVESSFDALDDLRHDAHRQLMGGAEQADPDSDEITVPDLPGNRS